MTWRKLNVAESVAEEVVSTACAGSMQSGGEDGTVVGAPSWMRKMKEWHPWDGKAAGQCQIMLWGLPDKKERTYACLDMLATDGDRNYVFEFKHATKYEPLALAEVLHHAEVLDKHKCGAFVGEAPVWWDSSRRLCPVIVSQYRPWLRGALRRLQRLSKGQEVARLVEVTALERAVEPKSFFLWLEEVRFDKCGSSGSPTDDRTGLPQALVGLAPDGVWNRDEDNTWSVWSKGGKRGGMVARTSPSSDQFLVWRGTDQEPGQYWLYEPGGDGGDAGPPGLRAWRDA